MRFFFFPIFFAFGFPLFFMGFWFLRAVFGNGHEAFGPRARRRELDELREEMSALKSEMSVIRENLADMTLMLHEVQQQILPKG